MPTSQDVSTTHALIPAKNAQIHWSTQERAMPTEGVHRVIAFDRFAAWTDEANDESRECSAGACCSDWLDGTDPRSTPEGIYAGWLLVGFKDTEAHIDALRQLARIEGCDWARNIVEAINCDRGDA